MIHSRKILLLDSLIHKIRCTTDSSTLFLFGSLPLFEFNVILSKCTCLRFFFLFVTFVNLIFVRFCYLSISQHTFFFKSRLGMNACTCSYMVINLYICMTLLFITTSIRVQASKFARIIRRITT